MGEIPVYLQRFLPAAETLDARDLHGRRVEQDSVQEQGLARTFTVKVCLLLLT